MTDIPVATPQGAHAGSLTRILYIDHTASMGGGEIALLNLVRHLDRARFWPVVVLFSDGPLRQQLVDAHAEVHLLELSPDVVNTRKDSLGGKTLLKLRAAGLTAAFTLRLARFISKNRIDVVHTNSLKADIIGGFAAKLVRRRLIWHVRDRIEDDYLPPKIVKLFRRLARTLPDCVVANSEATLKTVRLPARARTAVIHSGLDFGSRVSREPATTSHTPYRRIGLVGRISPWKGQHVFIESAAKVYRTFPDTRFLIIGAVLFNEADYEKQIREQVKTLGLEHVVEFTGFRNDVPDLVASLDVLAHASVVGEPFGQVVVEGMAAGKPVVATNGGGVPEIVVDGVTGLLVPMGDAAAMADAICRLLADPAAAAAMGAAGRARVHDHFTIQSTARKAERLYDSLTRRQPSSR